MQAPPTLREAPEPEARSISGNASAASARGASSTGSNSNGPSKSHGRQVTWDLGLDVNSDTVSEFDVESLTELGLPPSPPSKQSSPSRGGWNQASSLDEPRDEYGLPTPATDLTLSAELELEDVSDLQVPTQEDMDMNMEDVGAGPRDVTLAPDDENEFTSPDETF